jgi:hypothetical protein
MKCPFCGFETKDKMIFDWHLKYDHRDRGNEEVSGESKQEKEVDPTKQGLKLEEGAY